VFHSHPEASGERERRPVVARVIERIAGSYDVQEVEFGLVYTWCPGSVVVECDCGERPTLTSSATTCGCGVDYEAIVWEEFTARRPGDDEVAHPWRSLHYFAATGLSF